MLVENDGRYPIPGLWEGLQAPWTTEVTAPSIIGAMARVVAEHPHGNDEDRRLVRGLVSVDGPSRDRVWVTAERGGRPCALRTALTDIAASGWSVERDGLAPWCDGLRPEFIGAFDVDPVEFHARCLPHYRGVLHAWTDAGTARDYYKGWPRARQAAFEHEYLLYAAHDRDSAARTRCEPNSVLQDAAAWLTAHRRYVFRWIVLLRDEPLHRPDWLRHLETELVADGEALRPHLPPSFFDHSYERVLDAALSSTSAPTWASAWQDILERMDYGEARIRPLRLMLRLRDLCESTDADPDSALAVGLQRLRARLGDAIRWTW